VIYFIFIYSLDIQEYTMLKRIIYTIIYILLLELFFGCASTQKNIPTDSSPTGVPQMDESFDPLTLNDDDINFQKVSDDSNNKLETSVTLPSEEVRELENKLIDGFRIQVLSTKDLEKATTAKQMVLEHLQSLNLEAYMDFDSPYYKIRIGDFLNREEAEDFLGLVKVGGYPTAWIVPSKVWTNP
jgi:hypothetical protein